MDVHGDTQHTPGQALALLPLPDLGELSEEQVRGAICVWGGEALSGGSVVDLKPRRHRLLDGHFDTFPRACRPCIVAQARQAIRDHAGMCQMCVDDAGLCETRRVLYGLVVEHDRP